MNVFLKNISPTLEFWTVVYNIFFVRKFKLPYMYFFFSWKDKILLAKWYGILWHHLSEYRVRLSLKYLPILPDVIIKQIFLLFLHLISDFLMTTADCLFPSYTSISLSISFQTDYSFPTHYYCLRMLLLSSSNSSSCPTFCSVSLFCMLTTWWKTASSSSRLPEHLSLQH